MGISPRTSSETPESQPGSATGQVDRPARKMAGEVVISVRGLRMAYGDFEAVRGIDLEIRHGEIFAFLGPNGAGKTTTVEILEGYRARSAGDVSVLGEDPGRADRDWRARVGVVLQESQVEPELTVRECLQLYAGYYPSPRAVDETIALVELAEKADARCGHLSGGQQRRVDVALALIGDPDLVFLDEPTTGFDPSARRAAWEVIEGLRRLGKTIFLTTHYMEEAEYLADRIAVLAVGQIVSEGTPQTLGGRDRGGSEIRFALPTGTERAQLPDGLGPNTEHAGRQVLVRTAEPVRALHVLSEWALAHGYRLDDISVGRPTLEEIYLRLTGAQQ